MADGVKYMGGELDSVSLVSGAMAVTTSAGTRDVAYSAAALQLTGNTYRTNLVDESGEPYSIPTISTAWVSCYTYLYNGSSGTVFTLYDTNDRPFIRVTRLTGEPSFQENRSATATPNWVEVFSYSTVQYEYINLSIEQDSISLYVGGNLVRTGELLSLRSGFSYVHWGPWGSGDLAVSQLLVTENKSPVGARVFTRKASGEGTFSEMTGVFSNLVKTSINDTTSVFSTVAGQTSTFAYQDVTVPAGLEMGDVWVWNRVKNDGSPPSSMKQTLLIGGVKYQSGDLPVNGGFLPLPSVWPTNPAGGGWTAAAFNNTEIGMESTNP